ncbi:MAG TPA: hypothetical protein PLP17_16835, partial [Oligoflexia bacterium]|nr:hypothetical protein [Oligoflexia bacterium]
FSKGAASEALKEYALRGLVTVKKTKPLVLEALISDWAKRGVQSPKEELIIASEKDDVFELNRLSQLERRAAGVLGENCVRTAKHCFYTGDRVLITKNSRKLGVKNGKLGTVRRISPIFKKITVVLDSGRIVSINLTDFPHIALGYAITTHKAQGISTDNAFVLAGGSMQDRELTYVQSSRAKKPTRFYLSETDAGEELSGISRQMAKSRKKEMAHTLLDPELKTSISF